MPTATSRCCSTTAGRASTTPSWGSLVDCAIVKADDPEVYERMLTYVGNYIGR